MYLRAALVALLLTVSPQAVRAQTQSQSAPVDFWSGDIRLFGAAPGSGHADANVAKRRGDRYQVPGLMLDYDDRKSGDFSFRYRPVAGSGRFGFVAGLWGENWRLFPANKLRLFVKVKRAPGSAPADWDVALIDREGRAATGKLSLPAKGWGEVSLPLSELTPAAGFDWSRVRSVEFGTTADPATIFWLDGVRFENPAGSVAVTDKPIGQRIAQAQATRAFRAMYSFGQEAKKVPVADGPFDSDQTAIVAAFAKMMVNQDLPTANQILKRELEKSSRLDVWSLLHTPLYIRFYYMFSSKNGKYPGRMTKANEALLLETLWNRTVTKNDIHHTKESSWWMEGSENHDLNAKASNLVTSRIFMNEPDYKDRVYPNYGFGGGYNYGRAGYYGPDVDAAGRNGGGRASQSDGKKYTAKDHYEAWRGFFDTYFRERARRGFFLEYGSHTYSKHSLNFVDLVYSYSGDDKLKALVGDFITLYWADWAQVSITGLRGGPKTRHHGSVGGASDLGTAQLIQHYLGDLTPADAWHYWNLLSDYQAPPILWRMTLDRQAMDSFVYQARGIGEEENLWPRPLGTERSMLVDTDSRLLKYTYVTPRLTLGTQMDHPAAVHSHLSVVGRWHGMTVAGRPDARIVPVGVPDKPDYRGSLPKYDLEVEWHSVQDERVLIIQKARRWFAVHPTWFPAMTDVFSKPVGVWFGKDWDQKVEQGGWVFVRKGNAYAAVRPVLWDRAYDEANRPKNTGNQINFNRADAEPTVKLCDRCYSWNEDGTVLKLDDMDTPVIIEVGEQGQYADFDAFMLAIQKNPIALYRSVVPGFHELVYRGSGPNAREIVVNAGAPSIPRVGGVPVDYRPQKLFDSPWMTSDYKSGVIQLKFRDERMVLDFTKP